MECGYSLSQSDSDFVSHLFAHVTLCATCQESCLPRLCALKILTLDCCLVKHHLPDTCIKTITWIILFFNPCLTISTVIISFILCFLSLLQKWFLAIVIVLSFTDQSLFCITRPDICILSITLLSLFLLSQTSPVGSPPLCIAAWQGAWSSDPAQWQWRELVWAPNAGHGGCHHWSPG